MAKLKLEYFSPAKADFTISILQIATRVLWLVEDQV